MNKWAQGPWCQHHALPRCRPAEFEMRRQASDGNAVHRRLHRYEIRHPIASCSNLPFMKSHPSLVDFSRWPLATYCRIVMGILVVPSYAARLEKVFFSSALSWICPRPRYIWRIIMRLFALCSHLMLAWSSDCTLVMFMTTTAFCLSPIRLWPFNLELPLPFIESGLRPTNFMSYVYSGVSLSNNLCMLLITFA